MAQIVLPADLSLLGPLVGIREARASAPGQGKHHRVVPLSVCYSQCLLPVASMCVFGSDIAGWPIPLLAQLWPALQEGQTAHLAAGSS